MEPPKRETLNYSLKNIPIPPNELYMKRLVEMTESVMKRFRWRAFFFLKNEEEGGAHDDKKYGFNSRKCPPQIDELKHFEHDVAELIKNVRFRRICDDFQKTLRRDAARIGVSSDIFVRADKTKNLYRLGKQQYEKLLRENITKHYKTQQLASC